MTDRPASGPGSFDLSGLRVLVGGRSFYAASSTRNGSFTEFDSEQCGPAQLRKTLAKAGVFCFVAPSAVEGEVQNALARLGATHLQAVPHVLPSEQLEGATDAIRETIALGSSRQLTALGPVIVHGRALTIDRLDIHRVRAELARLGLHRRLSWVLENVAEALRSELEASTPPRAWAQKYRRALIVIETALGLAQDAFDPEREPVDVLDANVRSKQSLKETVASALSRKRGVATALTPKVFAKALRAARG